MITSSPFMAELCAITDQMYRMGWNERNGGNISYYVSEEELAPYRGELSVLRRLPLSHPFPELAGNCFLITGTGKYFRHVSSAPEKCLGLVRITEDGRAADLLWGYADGGRFTSEITMHLGAHLARRAIDPGQKVVVHAHPANLVAMTQLCAPDERAFTRSLWGVMTECVVIFPEGIGLMDWMLSSSDKIGLESAEKFRDYRMLVWAMHGITATGASLDEAFGLIETAEKAAEIWLKVTSCGGARRTITFAGLREVAAGFGLTTKPGWLDDEVAP